MPHGHGGKPSMPIRHSYMTIKPHGVEMRRNGQSFVGRIPIGGNLYSIRVKCKRIVLKHSWLLVTINGVTTVCNTPLEAYRNGNVSIVSFASDGATHYSPDLAVSLSRVATCDVAVVLEGDYVLSEAPRLVANICLPVV